MIVLKKIENNKNDLEKKYELITYVLEEDQEKKKYNKWDSGIIAKYVISERFSNKYIYKDFADYENSFIIPSEVFNVNNGNLKVYDEETKLFKNLSDDEIENEIEIFFNEPENVFIRKNCCLSIGDWGNYKRKMIEIIKKELNIFCKENRLHWSNSFEKDYIAVILKNGTLFLKYKEKKIEFKEEFDPNFLAEYKINLEFNSEKIKETKLENNHFFNFVKFKLNLDNNEKMGLFLGMFFDLFYTANASQHILFIVGKAGSGKTTLLEWFKNLQYSENWSAVSNISDLTDKFTDPNVYTLNYLLSDEVKETYITDNARFKSMISKNSISTEQKFKEKKTIKACAKIMAVGEKIPDLKQDGGAERRFCYLEMLEKQYKVPKEFLNLEEYLENRKEEDFLEMLIASMYIFAEKKYFKNKTAIKDAYDKIFSEIAEEIALNSISYISKLSSFLEYKENSYIEFNALLKCFKMIYEEEKNIKIGTFGEWLRIASKKIINFKNIKIFKSMKKDIKINGKVIFKQKVTYICNVGLNKENIKLELLDKPRKIVGENTEEQFLNLNSFFKTIDEVDINEFKKLTQSEIEEEIEKEIDKIEKLENLTLTEIIEKNS